MFEEVSLVEIAFEKIICKDMKFRYELPIALILYVKPFFVYFILLLLNLFYFYFCDRSIEYLHVNGSCTSLQLCRQWELIVAQIRSSKGLR